MESEEHNLCFLYLYSDDASRLVLAARTRVVLARLLSPTMHCDQ